MELRIGRTMRIGTNDIRRLLMEILLFQRNSTKNSWRFGEVTHHTLFNNAMSSIASMLLNEIQIHKRDSANISPIYPWSNSS